MLKQSRIQIIMTDKNQLWNEAGKKGLILAAVTSVFFFLSLLLPTIKMPAVLAGLLSGAVWLGKLVGCIWLVRYFMFKFVGLDKNTTNSDSFKFGCATTFLSSILFSGVQLAYTKLINPEYFQKTIDAAMSAYSSMMDSNTLAAIDQMMPYLPTISFFTSLVYCAVYGVVLSAVLSRNIPSSNPF